MINTLLTSLVVFFTLSIVNLSYFIIIRIQSHKPKKTSSELDSENLFGKDFYGRSEAKNHDFRAIIRCDRIPPESIPSFAVSGHADCATLSVQFEGNLQCRHGCLGLGSCVTVCREDAIVLKKGRIYITDQCTGCGSCISVCPKHLISLVPMQESKDWFCPVHGHEQNFKFCLTAKAGCKIKQSSFPETRFKILETWGIINGRSR